MIGTNEHIIDQQSLENYLNALIGKLYKILPICENSPETFPTYVRGLMDELLGFSGLVDYIDHDPAYVSILSLLQNFINTPECPVGDVRREVFGMISSCKKMIDRYTT